jgi:hypothetical protein
VRDHEINHFIVVQRATPEKDEAIIRLVRHTLRG